MSLKAVTVNINVKRADDTLVFSPALTADAPTEAEALSAAKAKGALQAAVATAKKDELDAAMLLLNV